MKDNPTVYIVVNGFNQFDNVYMEFEDAARRVSELRKGGREAEVISRKVL